jgi:hypothetical protein
MLTRADAKPPMRYHREPEVQMADSNRDLATGVLADAVKKQMAAIASVFVTESFLAAPGAASTDRFKKGMQACAQAYAEGLQAVNEAFPEG